MSESLKVILTQVEKEKWEKLKCYIQSDTIQFKKQKKKFQKVARATSTTLAGKFMKKEDILDVWLQYAKKCVEN